MPLRFGDCFLDVETHLLMRAGRPVTLTPKAFALLAALAERRPRVVTRAELRGLVWPEAVVGGTTLARLVNEIRSAVGDPGSIRTVRRVGYAFSAVADDEARRAGIVRCALQWGDRQIPLSEGENVIGRAADAAISVASERISRRHARILVAQGRATLEDLGSRNGTFVDGNRLEAPVELRHGSRIAVGAVELIFRVSSAEESTR